MICRLTSHMSDDLILDARGHSDTGFVLSMRAKRTLILWIQVSKCLCTVRLCSSVCIRQQQPIGFLYAIRLAYVCDRSLQLNRNGSRSATVCYRFH